MTTETDYAGTQWHYAYDGNGNCIEKRDALNNITRYDYDAAGQMTAMHTPEGSTTYAYDILGRLLEVTAPDAEPLTFEYDDKGRLVKEVQPYGEIRRNYPDNATAERTLYTPDGRRWKADTQVNKVGELKLLSISDEHQLTLERDDDGHEWHRQSDKGFILRQEHSLMGQLTAQRAGRNTEFFAAHEVADIPQPTLAGLAREYRYDAALNLVAANDERQWLRYVVNGNGQVTSVSDGDRLREHYQYDACGYPARRFDGRHDIDNERLYQKGHRLRQAGQHLFEYDEAGRMTAMQLWQDGHRAQLTKFRWNSQNQLTGVLTPGGQQWDYRYDAFGRRTEKICEQTGMRTTYLWDGDQPAEIREYRHHRLYSIRHLVFDGWQLLAQQIQFFTPNPENRRELIAGEVQTQYAVCTPTGEPLALFDPQGHRVWRQPPQSLYGMRLKAAGENAQFDPEQLYAGQWLDQESGLVYNRFRYFSPEASVYLTPDPIKLLGGENLYSYVQNPTGWIDPLGLACNNPHGYKAGDVDMHGNLSPGVNRAPGHSNTKADNLVQSHHPIQDHWAKKRIKDYKRNSAPATLLHSTSGMPHAQISAAQRTRRAASGGWNKTLKEEFHISYREMIDAGVPKAQARKALGDAYKYFDGLRGANKNNPFFDI
ncbi:RHS repeat-associated core domain-containing protein [Xenorhabdus nematophila]|uniref:RHS repeat-associated core domain-containing protein n=1 Tax=Xenorhabdus nematophila TaxID=628 RepID=UPI003D6F6EB8